MVPKLHAKGRSFKGAAAYLLHDKDRAATAERVAWVETRNLASDDPETAWRIMAATSMNQDRLKAQAGIKNTGRKSPDHVLHFSLAWHPDEKETLSQDEMRRAALGALRALGAADRQALFIAHSDERHPHLHVVVNRVSPEDGRILPSSKEKLNLSQWAEAYERERGQIFCEERVINNEARARGEFTRAAKEKGRQVYETEQAAQAVANDNKHRAERLREEQRKLNAALAQRGRDMAERHRQQWEELERRHKARTTEIRTHAERCIGMAKASTRERFRPDWRDLFRSQEDEKQAFQEREHHLLGKVRNVMDALTYARQVRGEDERRAGIGDLFGFMSSAGKRQEALERAQEAQKRALERQQASAEQQARQAIENERTAVLAGNREVFMAERSQVVLEQSADRAVLKAEWRSRTAEFQGAWRQFSESTELARETKEAYDQAADPEAYGRQVAEDRAAARELGEDDLDEGEDQSL